MHLGSVRPQVAHWWATGGDLVKAARFQNCADCIQNVTTQLLIARRQSVAWATMLRCLGGRKRSSEEACDSCWEPARVGSVARKSNSSQLKRRKIAAKVGTDSRRRLDATRSGRFGDLAPVDLPSATHLAEYLTRDLVELVGWQLRSSPLASVEVVRRTQMQPLRNELPTSSLLVAQSSGDRSRALRAWKRSRRQQNALQQRAVTRVTARQTDISANPSRLSILKQSTPSEVRNGSHYGDVKRRR